MPFSRRLLFALAGTLLAIAAIEGLAWLGASALRGRPFSWSEAQAERADSLARLSGEAVQDAEGAPEVPHPYLGYVRNPERQPSVSEFGYPSSTPLFTRREPDRVVVAVVGGSLAFHFVKEGLPAVLDELRRSPRFAGREFVVANLAVGGYKQPQQLMTLNYLLVLGFEFDVVINIDGFNEVALHEAENGVKGVFPIYPRAWSARARGGMSDAHARLLAGRVALAEERLAGWDRLCSTWPLRLSVAANLVWRVRHDSLAQAHWLALDALRRHRSETEAYAAVGPHVAFADDAELYEHLVGIWKRSSLQLARLCRANGIRYYHFLQPNQYVPGTKTLTAEERERAWREDQPYRSGAIKGYPLLVRAGRELRAQGVAFTDLTDAFADEHGTVYADDCCHVNELGNLILAARIASAIEGDSNRNSTEVATAAAGVPDG